MVATTEALEGSAEAQSFTPTEPEPERNPFVEMIGPHRAIILSLFGIYLTAVLILMSYGPTYVNSFSVLLVCVYLGLIVLPLIVMKNPGWFHPLIWGALSPLIFGGLLRDIPRFTGQLSHHTVLSGYDGGDLHRVVQFDLILSIVSLLALYAGYLTPVSSSIRLSRGRSRLTGWRTLPLFVIAVVFWVILITDSGGLSAHIISWGRGRSASLTGKGYLVSFIKLAIVGCMVWAAINPRAMRKPLFWLASLTAILGLWLVFGGRLAAVTFALIFLAMHTLYRGQVAWKLGGFTACGLLVFVVVSTGVRQSTYTQEAVWAFDDSVAEETIGLTLSEVQRRSGEKSADLVVLALVPQDEGYLWGRSYAALLASPIPRSLWPEKPRFSGRDVATTFYGSALGGRPAGAVGEAFWNFGVPGVALVFFAWGAFTRWLTSFFRANAKVTATVPIFVVLLLMAEPVTETLVDTAIVLVPLVATLVLLGVVVIGKRNGDHSKSFP